MTASPPASPAALDGLRVLELCDEKGVFVGKLLADMGADVVKVEPPSGDPTRRYGPFFDDEPHPDRSLWFWHYNTSKRAITLDLERETGRALLRRLAERADFVVESQPPGRLASLALDYPDLQLSNPALIMLSITPFGRSGPRHDELATDLTLLASGGPLLMCGYDDHSLPPVRCAGDHGYAIAGHFAFISALVALLYRDRTGVGQHIDVNMNAANCVTTEHGTFRWLIGKEWLSRQTGRHALSFPTMPTQVRCKDGRYVHSGVAARWPHQFKRLYEWLDELGLVEQFEDAPLLKAAGEDERLDTWSIDDETLARLAAGRKAAYLLADHMTAYELFTEGQKRGFQFGFAYAPEEVLEDPHFQARGFPVEVEHPELGRTFRYPGAPYQFRGSPWRIRRRAPLVGEDNAAVYGELGIDETQLATLAANGVI